MATTEVKVVFTTDVKEAADIEKAIKENKEIEERVNGYLSQYSIVNIPDTMKDLSSVGELLKVANAASYGQKNNQIVKVILNDYQSLIYETVSATSEYVSACISCIKKVKMAIKKAKKLDIEGCLKSIKGTSKKAIEMKEFSEKLIKLSTDLSEKSMKALSESTQAYVDAVTEFRANEKKKAELSSTIEGLKVEVEALKEQITELQELENNARDEAIEQERWEGFLSFLRAIVKGIQAAIQPLKTIKDALATVSGELQNTEKPEPKDKSSQVIKEKNRITAERREKKNLLSEKGNEYLVLVEKEKTGTLTSEESDKKSKLKGEMEVLEKEISGLRDQLKKTLGNVAEEVKSMSAGLREKEAQFRKYKEQYIAMEIKTTQELKKAISDLNTLSARNDYLEMSSKSLEIVIISMGKIRTTFENCRVFWTQVSSHCQALSNVNRVVTISKFIKDTSSPTFIKFENTLKSLSINWLALAKVNHDANLSIEVVKTKFDEVMTNLPGKNESSKIVKECLDGVQQNAATDIAQLEELRKSVADTPSQ